MIRPCKVCFKQPVLRHITTISGVQYAYMCGQCPQAVTGITMRPTEFAARRDWNLCNQPPPIVTSEHEIIAPYKIGDYVEKHTGDAQYGGWIVAVYSTRSGQTRYVIEVDPQRFQMIVSEAQIKLVQ